MLTILCLVMLVICCKLQKMKLDQKFRASRIGEPRESREDTQESRGGSGHKNRAHGAQQDPYQSRESAAELNPQSNRNKA